MEILKDNRVYTVKESENKWTVKQENGKLSVSYEVSKELCETEQKLREYVQNSDLF